MRTVADIIEEVYDYLEEHCETIIENDKYFPE